MTNAADACACTKEVVRQAEYTTRLPQIIDEIAQAVNRRWWETTEWLIPEEVEELDNLGYKLTRTCLTGYMGSPPSKRHKAYRISWKPVDDSPKRWWQFWRAKP